MSPLLHNDVQSGMATVRKEKKKEKEGGGGGGKMSGNEDD
jgi:hypothetical protein